MSTTIDIGTPPEAGTAAGGPARSRDPLRAVARGAGQTLITLGLVALLFVGYELWVTDVLAAEQQQELSEQIRDQWADTPTVGAAPSGEALALPPATAAEPAPQPEPPSAPAPIDVALGEPFAVLHIPRLGLDYEQVVVEGTSQVQLALGPGHYLGTAMPGEQGNVALAGHRVGRGSPFLHLDRLRPGDALVVETADTWFVYRVLGDSASGDFDADPTGIPGQRIVRPGDVSVISATPGEPGGAPATGAYLTLTTCHPRYSAEQRLIVHARLDGAPVSKATAPDGPPELGG